MWWRGGDWDERDVVRPVMSEICTPAGFASVLMRSQLMPLMTAASAGRQNAVVLHAPKSGKSFWSLGDFAAEFEESKRRAAPMLRQLWECQQEQQQRQQQLQQQGWAAEDDEQQWQQPRPTIVL